MGKVKEDAGEAPGGVQPIAPATVAYVRYPHGGLGRISQTGGTVELGDGVEITEAEYRAELAELDASREAYKAELTAADDANTRNDYGELRAAGISDAAARRMSGYAGPSPEAGR